MKYRISKTSGWFGEDKPYSKAYQEDRLWYVDIETLDDLNDIIKETCCPLVLNGESIEIYDDYRE